MTRRLRSSAALVAADCQSSHGPEGTFLSNRRRPAGQERAQERHENLPRCPAFQLALRLVAADDLADRDQAVCIVDEGSGISEHSKAFGVNPRTLSLQEGTSVTELLLASGRRMCAVNAWRRTPGRTRRLFGIDLSKVDYRYPSMLIYSQAKSEHILAEAVTDRGVEVEWGVEVTGIDADAGAVEAV